MTLWERRYKKFLDNGGQDTFAGFKKMMKYSAFDEKGNIIESGSLTPYEINKLKKKNPGKKLYEKFHGKKPRGTKTVTLNDMTKLVYLGEAVAIEYYAHKPHIEENPEIFRHDFKKRCEVYTNGKELIIHGSSIKIKEDGIHG